ncbi:MAG TPA: class I SAM-dependent methyltransferase [Balneolales bacterium]|nr:class I SAM-dependent methyltransferase [Balneolales bacterium]
MELVNKDIEQYAYDHTTQESELLKNVVKATNERLEYSQMLSGRVEGRLLQMLIRLSHAKKILEIGMFTGYSALSMAEALPDDGRIITCDTNDRYRKIAEEFFTKSPHGGKITIKMGPALETIPKLHEVFDLVFMDADKGNYPEYYELIMPKLKVGGILIVDNALWSGTVLQPTDHKAKAIDQLNKKIAKDARVQNILLTVRDGIHIVQKLSV